MPEPVNEKSRLRWAKVAADVREALGHHRAGRLDRAEALYRKILNKVPDHPDALHMLGAIANTRGRPERAMQLIGKVLSIFPNHADAHLNLGNSYSLVGKRADAMACYRRAIALKPDFALAHSSLGRELNAEGAFEAGLAASRRAIELDPAIPDGHVNLGVALWNLGRLGEAEASLRKALQLRPDDLHALSYLALILLETSRFEDARRVQEKVVALQPRDARAHRGLAVSEFRTGDIAAALKRFSHSVELEPDFAEGWTSYGWALRAVGRFDEAVACFRRALAINPDLAEAHRSLAATGQQAADQAEIERLRALVANPDLDDNDRVAAGFALGSVLDGADRYDEAFQCFSQANALARRKLIASGRGYDPDAFRARIDRLIETYTPQFFAAVAAGGVPSELPVFIVGMPRSGTTLVEQIAASHSQVFGAGELTEIGRLREALPEPGVDPEATAHWLAVAPGLAVKHLDKLAKLGSGAARVIDKLPDNVFNLGVIAALFPASRVILCNRDPRDICLSSYFQLFAGGNPYSYDLAECAHRYRQVERLCEHWRRVLPVRMLEIRYEALVGDLEGESRRLIDFLGLEWEPACLEFHRSERVVVTQSTWQVRQPLYARSVARWRHYERHLIPLIEALGSSIERPG